MEDPCTIRLDEVRSALALILDQAERELGSSVDLDADYYWEVLGPAAYDPSSDPTLLLAAGQLSDDVESVRELLDRPAEEGVFVWHDLAHVCGILRRIAVMSAPSAK